MNKSIRWQQRFVNFEKSYLQLQNSLQIESPSDTERAGIIQFFEISFELAWKTMKDFLEAEGFQVASPRETFKQAFQGQYIQDGHVWIEALDDRNLTTHTYDAGTAKKVEKLIREKYFLILEKFYLEFVRRRIS